MCCVLAEAVDVIVSGSHPDCIRRRVDEATADDAFVSPKSQCCLMGRRGKRAPRRKRTCIGRRVRRRKASKEKKNRVVNPATSAATLQSRNSTYVPSSCSSRAAFLRTARDAIQHNLRRDESVVQFVRGRVQDGAVDARALEADRFSRLNDDRKRVSSGAAFSKALCSELRQRRLQCRTNNRLRRLIHRTRAWKRKKMAQLQLRPLTDAERERWLDYVSNMTREACPDLHPIERFELDDAEAYERLRFAYATGAITDRAQMRCAKMELFRRRFGPDAWLAWDDNGEVKMCGKTLRPVDYGTHSLCLDYGLHHAGPTTLADIPKCVTPEQYMRLEKYWRRDSHEWAAIEVFHVEDEKAEAKWAERYAKGEYNEQQYALARSTYLTQQFGRDFQVRRLDEWTVQVTAAGRHSKKYSCHGHYCGVVSAEGRQRDLTDPARGLDAPMGVTAQVIEFSTELRDPAVVREWKLRMGSADDGRETKLLKVDLVEWRRLRAECLGQGERVPFRVSYRYLCSNPNPCNDMWKHKVKEQRLPVDGVLADRWMPFLVDWALVEASAEHPFYLAIEGTDVAERVCNLNHIDAVVEMVLRRAVDLRMYICVAQAYQAWDPRLGTRLAEIRDGDVIRVATATWDVDFDSYSRWVKYVAEATQAVLVQVPEVLRKGRDECCSASRGIYTKAAEYWLQRRLDAPIFTSHELLENPFAPAGRAGGIHGLFPIMENLDCYARAACPVVRDNSEPPPLSRPVDRWRPWGVSARLNRHLYAHVPELGPVLRGVQSMGGVYNVLHEMSVETQSQWGPWAESLGWDPQGGPPRIEYLWLDAWDAALVRRSPSFCDVTVVSAYHEEMAQLRTARRRHTSPRDHTCEDAHYAAIPVSEASHPDWEAWSAETCPVLPTFTLCPLQEIVPALVLNAFSQAPLFQFCITNLSERARDINLLRMVRAVEYVTTRAFFDYRAILRYCDQDPINAQRVKDALQQFGPPSVFSPRTLDIETDLVVVKRIMARLRRFVPPEYKNWYAWEHEPSRDPAWALVRWWVQQFLAYPRVMALDDDRPLAIKGLTDENVCVLGPYRLPFPLRLSHYIPTMEETDMIAQQQLDEHHGEIRGLRLPSQVEDTHCRYSAFSPAFPLQLDIGRQARAWPTIPGVPRDTVQLVWERHLRLGWTPGGPVRYGTFHPWIWDNCDEIVERYVRSLRFAPYAPPRHDTPQTWVRTMLSTPTRLQAPYQQLELWVLLLVSHAIYRGPSFCYNTYGMGEIHLSKNHIENAAAYKYVSTRVMRELRRLFAVIRRCQNYVVQFEAVILGFVSELTADGDARVEIDRFDEMGRVVTKWCGKAHAIMDTVGVPSIPELPAAERQAATETIKQVYLKQMRHPVIIPQHSGQALSAANGELGTCCADALYGGTSWTHNPWNRDPFDLPDIVWRRDQGHMPKHCHDFLRMAERFRPDLWDRAEAKAMIQKTVIVGAQRTDDMVYVWYHYYMCQEPNPWEPHDDYDKGLGPGGYKFPYQPLSALVFCLLLNAYRGFQDEFTTAYRDYTLAAVHVRRKRNAQIVQMLRERVRTEYRHLMHAYRHDAHARVVLAYYNEKYMPSNPLYSRSAKPACRSANWWDYFGMRVAYVECAYVVARAPPISSVSEDEASYVPPHPHSPCGKGLDAVIDKGLVFILSAPEAYRSPADCTLPTFLQTLRIGDRVADELEALAKRRYPFVSITTDSAPCPCWRHLPDTVIADIGPNGQYKGFPREFVYGGFSQTVMQHLGMSSAATPDTLCYQHDPLEYEAALERQQAYEPPSAFPAVEASTLWQSYHSVTTGHQRRLRDVYRSFESTTDSCGLCPIRHPYLNHRWMALLVDRAVALHGALDCNVASRYPDRYQVGGQQRAFRNIWNYAAMLYAHVHDFAASEGELRRVYEEATRRFVDHYDPDPREPAAYDLGFDEPASVKSGFGAHTCITAIWAGCCALDLLEQHLAREERTPADIGHRFNSDLHRVIAAAARYWTLKRMYVPVISSGYARRSVLTTYLGYDPFDPSGSVLPTGFVSELPWPDDSDDGISEPPSRGDEYDEIPDHETEEEPDFLALAGEDIALAILAPDGDTSPPTSAVATTLPPGSGLTQATSSSASSGMSYE